MSVTTRGGVFNHLDVGVERRCSFWDPMSECTIIASTPELDPDLWREFLAGAYRAYDAFGVKDALEYDQIADGEATSLFFVAVDRTDAIVAGMRVQGPYLSAESAHAITEWTDGPGRAAVRKMVLDRVPFGVVEVKAVWVSQFALRRSELASTITRCVVHAMSILNAQFVLVTTAGHVVERYGACGAVPASHIPATPYPSDAYETIPMWWDSQTYAELAQPSQVALIMSESARLNEYETRVHGCDGLQAACG